MNHALELERARQSAPTVSPDDLASGLAPWLSRDGTGIIRFDNMSDLQQVHELLSRISGNPDAKQASEAVVQHEGEHLEAAAMIGSRIIGVGVQIFNVENEPDEENLRFFAFFEVAYSDSITTLHRAAVAAYPIDPSSGDIVQVNGWGFTLEEVAQRALSHNRHNPTSPIPVPLSYKGADRAVFV